MTEEQRDYKLKQFKELLNQALNEAMCYNKRIKDPNSNNIAEFVNDFLARKELKSDLLHSVGKSYSEKDMDMAYDKGYSDGLIDASL